MRAFSTAVGPAPWPVRNAVAIILLTACLTACSDGDGERLLTVTLTVEGAGGASAGLKAEVAATPAERTQGLMFRQSLGEREATLFIFPEETVNPFWMRNTTIFLTIAFLAADGRVLELREGAPLDETLLHPSGPYRYALEVNLGWFGWHGLGPGARVILPRGLPQGQQGCTPRSWQGQGRMRPRRVTMAKVHFGVNVPQIKRTWEETSAAAREFEALGFDSIWVNDHLYGPQSPHIPILEAWSTVAALAAITERVEIGTLVTPAGMRNPAHLGKTIATADAIAGGRVIPGLGGGWMEREFTDFGMPFLSTRERLRQLEETVVLLKRMWSEESPVDFAGEHVRVERLVCEPKPPRTPPILVGGAGERVTLRIAAEHAAIWNNLAGHHTDLARKVAVLREHCRDTGRDPDEVTVSQQCLVTIAPDESSAGPLIERAQTIFGGHLGDPTGPLALSGSPERIRDQIARNREAGCEMFVIEFFGRDTREPARLFAEHVLPYI